MKDFSAQEMVSFGWATFKSRWEFFVGATALLFLASIAIDRVATLFPEHASEGFLLWGAGLLITGGVSALLNMGFINLMLKAHDTPHEARAGLLWHPYPFWRYVGASILAGVIVIAGIILLVVPGIIAGLALTFTTVVVIDRNLDPIAALKESARITKGHRIELLLFFVLLLGVNILGAIALLVGLLVSVPVSYLAFMHAYRTLSAHASATVSHD